MKKVLSLLIVLAMVISMVPAVFAATGPVITGQPTSQTIKLDETALFTVKAEGTDLTYQWQYRFPNDPTWRDTSMEGNKTATLSVGGKVSRHGYRYRCVVTDGNGVQAFSSSATLTVIEAIPIEITTQPVSGTATPTTSIQFHVAANGENLSYQWQYLLPQDDEWRNTGMTGNKTDTLTVEGKPSRHGYQYRCVITNNLGQTGISEPAKLTVEGVAFPEINAQPEDVSVNIGQFAEFSVDVTGNVVSYQWQCMPVNSFWRDTTMQGNKTNTMTVEGKVSRHGYQYRCVITDSQGAVIVTEPATMIIVSDATITEQPQSATVLSGENAVFHFGAESDGPLTYQWQYQLPGDDVWHNTGMEGNKTPTLTVGGKPSRNGYQYRCVLTDELGATAISDAVTLTIASDATITEQPQSASVKIGQVAVFHVAATSARAVTYQWQYLLPGDTVWYNTGLEGNKTDTLSVEGKLSRHGYQYRCVITDFGGMEIETDAVTLSIIEATPIEIIEQPVDATVEVDKEITFHVEVKGEGLTYQWQYQMPGDPNWYNTGLEGNKTATLVVGGKMSRNGYMYRCVIEDQEGRKGTSDVAVLTVTERTATPLEITAQPTAQTAVLGENAEFTVAANGDELKYQWQTNASGEWADIADATAATLSVAAAEENAGAQYRCVITDKYGETATSEAAALTVEYPLGHINNPHMITLNRVPYACETGVVAPGATYYTSINNGMNAPELVIENADVNVIYKGETYTPVDGVVTVVLDPCRRGANEVQIVNVGAEATAYTLMFSLPVGTRENPLVIEDITSSAEAVLKEGDLDGYEMVWTAPEAGLVQLSASSSVWNGEFGVTVTHGVKQYNLPADADAETGDVNIMVEEGDVLFFTAALICEYEIDEYWDIVLDENGDPVVKTYNPAGYVYISAVYETGTEVYPYTISAEAMPGTVTTLNTIKPGESAFYRIGGSGGVTLTVEDENTVINYNGVAYAPVNGVITIELAEITWWDDSKNIIEIVNNGTEAKAYDLTFTYPEGDMMNPAELVIGENTATVEAASVGYFYTWTATANGTLSVTMNCDNWSYVVNNESTWEYGERQECGVEGAQATYEIAVNEGDVIQVSVNTYNAEGDTPAGTITFTAAFAEENLGDVEIEQPVDPQPDDGEEN